MIFNWIFQGILFIFQRFSIEFLKEFFFHFSWFLIDFFKEFFFIFQRFSIEFFSYHLFFSVIINQIFLIVIRYLCGISGCFLCKVTVKIHRRSCTHAHFSINGWMVKVVWIGCSVYRGVFYLPILFYEKYERNRWFTLRWSETFIHSAHLGHSPIYAKMGAQLLGVRARATMYLDRGCCSVLSSNDCNVYANILSTSSRLLECGNLSSAEIEKKRVEQNQRDRSIKYVGKDKYPYQPRWFKYVTP